MKVLVTGSNGQLGKTLQEFYASSKDVEFTFTTRDELDITNTKEIDQYLKKNDIDYCINCAAYTNVEKAEDEPEHAFLINSIAVHNLALACKKKGIILIHISTDYVFDGEKTKPYKESDETYPINTYGKSKLKGEQNIKAILDHYFIIRTSWLYSRFGHNFLDTILKKVLHNDDLKIVSSQTGSPTSCDDLAEFIYFLILNKDITFGIYHFTSQKSTSWYGFAKHIASHFKAYDLKKIQPLETYKTKAERPSYSVLDLSKTLNIYPKINSWIHSVNETIASFKVDE